MYKYAADRYDTKTEGDLSPFFNIWAIWVGLLLCTHRNKALNEIVWVFLPQV